MLNPNSIMAPSDETKVIVTNDAVFQNSKCLFIEFFDVIRAPWYTAIQSAKDILGSVVDLSTTDGWKEKGWDEWYLFRPYKNPLQCFPPVMQWDTKEETDENYERVMDAILEQEDIIRLSKEMPFLDVLYRLFQVGNPTEDIVVWTKKPYYSIENYLYNAFGQKVRYVHGELDSVLSDIPKDSTYVFSDVMHINTLVDLKRIEYASIILAGPFLYNFNRYDDNTVRLKVDIDELSKQYLFKFSMFDVGLI